MRFYIISEPYGLAGTANTYEEAERIAFIVAVVTARTVYVHDRLTEPTRLSPNELTELVMALRGLGDRQMVLLRRVDDDTFLDAAMLARSADQAQGTQRSRALP